MGIWAASNEREGGPTRPSFIDAVRLELNEVLYRGIRRRGEDHLLFFETGPIPSQPIPKRQKNLMWRRSVLTVTGERRVPAGR